VAIVTTVQAIVDNGGFQYLFESTFPFTPPYSAFSDAYRQIGALDAADRLDRAVALFPFENPHTNPQRRNEFMDSLDPGNEFFLLGDEVCGDERVWRLLEEHVKKHAEAFGR
jgi:hypothetical protein